MARVHYPGLSCHAQHQRASALFDGRYGGLLGVELAEGIDCFDFLNRLRIVLMARTWAIRAALPCRQRIRFITRWGRRSVRR